MTDEGIPGVDPVELIPADPLEWITTTGKVRYRKPRTSARCADCMHLIAQYLQGRIRLDRPPGLARRAVVERVQGAAPVPLCEHHSTSRQQREEPPCLETSND